MRGGRWPFPWDVGTLRPSTVGPIMRKHLEKIPRISIMGDMGCPQSLSLKELDDWEDIAGANLLPIPGGGTAPLVGLLLSLL